MASGVYIIQNTVTNQYYIGSSVSSIDHRFKTHISDLKLNKHHSPRLQNSWNKYGAEAFEFSVLELCTKESVLENEQFFIDYLNPVFNVCKTAGNCFGRRFSKETKKKMSIVAKKRGLNAFLLKQQEKKLPPNKDGRKFCSKKSHWVDESYFYKNINHCKDCVVKKSKAIPGARRKDAINRGTKILCKTPTTEIGFYSLRDAVKFFSDQYPKLNKTFIRKNLDTGNTYYNMTWETIKCQ